MTDDKLRAAAEAVERAYLANDEKGLLGACADLSAALAASAPDEPISRFFDGPHGGCTVEYRHNHDMRPLVDVFAASADEGPRCPTCNSGPYRQPLCSDPWHAARPAVPEALDVERIAADAIGLFLEYRDTHGHEEHVARVAAVAEVIEGVAALRSKEPT